MLLFGIYPSGRPILQKLTCTFLKSEGCSVSNDSALSATSSRDRAVGGYCTGRDSSLSSPTGTTDSSAPRGSPTMWTTLAFAAALTLGPAQAGQLELTNARTTYGLLGGPR